MGIEVASIDSTPSEGIGFGLQPKPKISVFKDDNSLELMQRDQNNSPGLLKPRLLFEEHRRLRDGNSKQTVNLQGEESSPNQRTDVPINVIARVRPLIPNEMRHPVCIEVMDDSIVNGHKTQIVVRKDVGTFTQKQKIYSFEKVLDPESTQQKVFSEVNGRALCNAFLNGQNCTIFVYGPTSTGKTFTMQGNAEEIIQGNNRSQFVSANASPEQSNMSQCEDSVMTNEFDLRR